MQLRGAFLRKFLLVALGCATLFLAPSLWLHATTPILIPEAAQPAKAALIFGAVVRNGLISPLHRERLDTGMKLLKIGTVERLVVSNTPVAAEAMRRYLDQQGVAAANIELDTQAERSPDTCAFEARRTDQRSVIFVSQRFHLPRLALHCRRYNLKAQYVMADSPTRAPSSFISKARIRTTRFLRETLLTWGVLLGIYPHQ